ncbi:prephenate dehydratase [Fulvivirga lutea]|uniref:Bifunctional chorismate mutase/prephenate dehydratase n=1 Tax=Fulvivirga lutea TaxID=2810512 RepID=A0A975A1E7_9BACT|nr:prephenate dehydratase [Fulvivirga lutea]QSE97751.1 prephenate dehydratase [Fulvivirga lutea]
MSEINSIEEARVKIDSIDAELLRLLNDRMEVVKSIGDLKRNSNGAIYRPDREQAIIQRLSELTTGRLNKKAIEAIFLEIFAVSRNIELSEKVAYLGPEGSFTHQAAESRFGAISEYIPLKTIKSVFEAVDTKRVRFGVIPVENNQEGIVNDTIKLLNSLDINIVAELPMPIHFTFGSINDDLKAITKIYSKDIAFQQCSKFIEEYFNHDVELIPVDSTSKAAQLASEKSGTAAICSPIAAKLYKLPVLFDNIEDSADNFTRFLIISDDFKNNKSGNDKTSILVKLSSEPGSLVNFLQKFYDANINLNKIESYPAKKGKGFSYQFLLEFDGHFDDASVSQLLADNDSIKWLGSYPKLC